mgnify:CR=1 FL=1
MELGVCPRGDAVTRAALLPLFGSVAAYEGCDWPTPPPEIGHVCNPDDPDACGEDTACFVNYFGKDAELFEVDDAPRCRAECVTHDDCRFNRREYGRQRCEEGLCWLYLP